MTQMDDRSRLESQDYASRVWLMVSGNWMTQATYAAVELQLADLLVDVRKTGYVLSARARFI